MKVLRVFRSSYFPDGGSVPEQILELADGTKVYFNTAVGDTICAGWPEAVRLCVGDLEREEDDALRRAWSSGYDVPKAGDR